MKSHHDCEIGLYISHGLVGRKKPSSKPLEVSQIFLYPVSFITYVHEPPHVAKTVHTGRPADAVLFSRFMLGSRKVMDTTTFLSVLRDKSRTSSVHLPRNDYCKFSLAVAFG